MRGPFGGSIAGRDRGLPFDPADGADL